MHRSFLFIFLLFFLILGFVGATKNTVALRDEGNPDYRELPRIAQSLFALANDADSPQMMFRPTTTANFFYEHTYNAADVYYYDSAQGHFRLWYVLTSADAVPSTQWVRTAANALEDAWVFQIEQLGFLPPPSDRDFAPVGTDPAAYGNDEKYDVYFLDLSAHVISGFTQSEWPTTGDTVYPRASTSYIVLENDFANKSENERETYLKVTAGHEFHHAIQYAYSSAFPRWWMEATAVWIEDAMYPEVNSYIPYTNIFLEEPYKPLWQRGNAREYGSAIWPQCLADISNYGPELIRDIYTGMSTHSAQSMFFGVVDDVLHTYHSSLSQAFATFTIWNYFTGTRYKSDYYHDGGDFYTVETDGVFSYPDSYIRRSETGKSPAGLGCNYIQFDNLNNAKRGDLRISFDGEGEPSYQWNVTLLVITNTGYSYYYTISLDESNNTGAMTINHPHLLQKIVMIPAVVSPFAPELTYTYQAEIVSSTNAITDGDEVSCLNPIEGVSAFPNPFSAATEFYIGYAQESWQNRVPITIRVYNAAGQRVRTVIDHSYNPVNMAWDARDDNGELVSPGTYFYQIDALDQQFHGKITYLR